MDWSTQQAKYGALVQPKQQTAQRSSSKPEKKKRGGIGGFLEGIVRGAAEPFSYLANTAIINPIKEESAKLTGNKTALRNARKEANREIGLGEEGTNLTGGLKKLGGNAAQAFLTAAAPGVTSVGKGAAVGAGTGAGAALAQEDSTLEDVLTGGAFGGATGGALTGGANFLSKMTKGNKAAGNIGSALDAEASGITRGTSLKGGRMVTPEYETELLDFMREGSKKYIPSGVKAGKPRTQSGSAQEVFNAVKDTLTKQRKDINRAISADEAQKLVTDIDFKLLNDAGITGKTPLADKFKSLIKNKDIDGLEKLRMQYDDIGYTAAGAGKTAKAAEARALRDTIDDFVTSLEDEGAAAYKATKGDYQKAKDMLELTSKGSKAAKGSIKSSQNVAGALIGSQTAQGAKSKAGNVLTRMTGGMPEAQVPEVASNFASRLIRQGASAQAGASAVPGQEEVLPEDVLGELDTLGQESMLEPEIAEEESSSPFSPENVEANAQQILSQGGTMKDVSEYLSIVEGMQKLSGGAQKKPLNSTAAGTLTDLQNGLANIRELSSLYENSGANNPLTSWFRGRNPYDTEAQNLQASTARIKQVIGKALEGGVLRKEDEVKYAKILPKLSDTDAVAQNKINAIADDLERKIILFQQNLGGGDGGLDLSSLTATR